MKKIIFILILTIIAKFSGVSQDRKLIWVHGLEGTQYTMRLYSDYFHNHRRIITNNTPGYSTRSGVEAGAEELYTYIAENRGANTITVAQSMGALVSLDMFYKYGTNAYGGIITTGGPMLGAPVARNIDAPEYKQLLQDMRKKGTSGWNTAVSLIIRVLNPTLAQINSAFNLTAIAFNWAFDKIFDFLENSITDAFFGGNTAKADLRPDSPIIKKLQNPAYLGNIPRIAIWGNEDNPWFLRLAGSVLENKIHKNIPLGKLGDETVINTVNVIANTAKTGRNIAVGVALSMSIAAVIAGSINDAALAAACGYTAIKLNVSYKYWHSEVEPGFERIVGAYKTVKQQQYYQDYVCTGKYTKSSLNIQPSDCHWETKVRTVYVTVPTLSDGVVPEYSAKAMPGVQTKCIVEAKHTNHRQLTNSYVVRDLLRGIFEGGVQDTRKRDFFKIKKRK